MSFSYVLTTDVGKVRLFIPDNKPASYIFEDDEIETFLAMESGIKRATAMALETIASNEALVLKVIKLLDVQTDGAKVSDALLKRAALLRQQAGDDDLVDDAGFDIAEMVLDPFTYRERLTKQALRY